jgi:hypothetical protein
MTVQQGSAPPPARAQQTAAAMLVSETPLSLGVAAAAELVSVIKLFLVEESPCVFSFW